MLLVGVGVGGAVAAPDTEVAKLRAIDASAGDQFGWSIALSGDTVVVGSFVDDDKGINSGSAYVFTRSGTTWTQQAKLTASDGLAGHEFGRSVSVSGDRAVVGAPLDDDPGLSTGSAYVFWPAAVIDIIGVGINPRGIAVNAETNRIYAFNGAGNVSVIDGNTNTVVAFVNVGATQFSGQDIRSQRRQ